MKKNPLILIAFGVLLIMAGGWMLFTRGSPTADPGLRQACEASMTERGANADLIAQCGQLAFATATTATDASSAARSISAANNSEIGGNAFSVFLVGLGLALVVGGFVIRRGVGRVTT